MLRHSHNRIQLDSFDWPPLNFKVCHKICEFNLNDRAISQSTVPKIKEFVSLLHGNICLLAGSRLDPASSFIAA